ncbi:MAG: putative porin [Elusimicrobiales bacterium]
MRTSKTAAKIAALSVVLTGMAAAADAQLDKIRLPEFVESVKFSGDLRIRQEDFYRRGNGYDSSGNPTSNGTTTDIMGNTVTLITPQTDRRRFRLRYGLEAAFKDTMSAGFRLGTGTGQQVTENQTMTGLSGEKPLWIDLAWMRWAPSYDNGSFYVQGGKMKNELWRPYSDDIIWSDDLNPEGFMEGGQYKLGGLALFANLLQMDAGQPSKNSFTGEASSDNQWCITEQLGAEGKVSDVKIKSAVAYNRWTGRDLGVMPWLNGTLKDSGSVTQPVPSLTGGLAQDGNRRDANGLLLNEFGVAQWSTQVDAPVMGVPVSFQATLLRNVLASGIANSQHTGVNPSAPLARDGYQYGVIAGKAAKEGTWEGGLFYKYAEADCTISDINSADFGDGGTNRKGTTFWLAYAPRDWMQIKAKGYITETIDPMIEGNVVSGKSGSTTPVVDTAVGRKDINRFQLDITFRF